METFTKTMSGPRLQAESLAPLGVAVTAPLMNPVAAPRTVPSFSAATLAGVSRKASTS